MERPTLGSLPAEVLLHILSHLGHRDLNSVARVSRQAAHNSPPGNNPEVVLLC